MTCDNAPKGGRGELCLHPWLLTLHAVYHVT
jgi:hypothetical protein